jgi:hypothetical protein
MTDDDPSGASGGCLCGAVRFRITFPTKWCAHCHCSMCRRAHGAAFVTFCGVPAGQFTITHGADDLARYDSSAHAWRRFCRKCGSTLTFEGERWADEVHVVLANVDDPIDRPPAAHCYYDGHVPWLELADALPKLGGPSGNEPL